MILILLIFTLYIQSLSAVIYYTDDDLQEAQRLAKTFGPEVHASLNHSLDAPSEAINRPFYAPVLITPWRHNPKGRHGILLSNNLVVVPYDWKGIDILQSCICFHKKWYDMHFQCCLTVDWPMAHIDDQIKTQSIKLSFFSFLHPNPSCYAPSFLWHPRFFRSWASNREQKGFLMSYGHNKRHDALQPTPAIQCAQWVNVMPADLGTYMYQLLPFESDIRYLHVHATDIGAPLFVQAANSTWIFAGFMMHYETAEKQVVPCIVSSHIFHLLLPQIEGLLQKLGHQIAHPPAPSDGAWISSGSDLDLDDLPPAPHVTPEEGFSTQGSVHSDQDSLVNPLRTPKVAFTEN